MDIKFLGRKYVVDVLDVIVSNTDSTLVSNDEFRRGLRFNTIKSRLHRITSKQLSLVLKILVKSRLLKHTMDSSVMPVRSYYDVTVKGSALSDMIKDIRRL